MNVERPNLEQLDPDVRSYIQALENKIAHLTKKEFRLDDHAEEPAPCEEPTTINIVSVSAKGLAKRTPRHLYARQRRGGMGVFDLDTAENDHPAFLTCADQSESVVLITNKARAFRVPLERIVERPVNSKGQSIIDRFRLLPEETITVVLPGQTIHPYAAILSATGHVRWLVGHLLGEKLKAGTGLYDSDRYGPPVAGCWAPTNSEILVTSQKGRGIRFPSRQLPLQSCALGLRLDQGDVASGIAAVNDDSRVLMVTADGKGTIRHMSGVRANKSLGNAGKITIKTEALIGVHSTFPGDDVFIISRLGKIIRFPAEEIPEKTGAVQGVKCMALRADECKAVLISAN